MVLKALQKDPKLGKLNQESQELFHVVLYQAVEDNLRHVYL